MNLEDLEQRASDNYAMRLAALLDAILVSDTATVMGVESDIAYHLHYGTMTVRRLAAMVDLPEEAISLDTKIGAYWVAINNKATVEQVCAAVEAGVETPAQMKAFLGVESERGPVCVDCPVCGARFEK